MRNGHKEAQEMFLNLGKAKGFIVSKTFSKELPTDGVWFIKHPLDETNVPFVAIEVIASETPKQIIGSIGILKQVKPMIAIVLLHESEMARKSVLRHASSEKVKSSIARKYQIIQHEIQNSQQRFVIWNEHNLSYWTNLYLPVLNNYKAN